MLHRSLMPPTSNDGIPFPPLFSYHYTTLIISPPKKNQLSRICLYVKQAVCILLLLIMIIIIIIVIIIISSYYINKLKMWTCFHLEKTMVPNMKITNGFPNHPLKSPRRPTAEVLAEKLGGLAQDGLALNLRFFCGKFWMGRSCFLGKFLCKLFCKDSNGILRHIYTLL